MVSPSPGEHYREKAIELRRMASEQSVRSARKEFEAIAARYERLANRIEGIEEKQRQFGAR